MLQLVVGIFTAVFLFLVILWYSLNLKYLIKLRNVSGPIPLPILGNALHFLNLNDVLPTLQKFARKYGSPYTAYISYQKPWLVISDPKLMSFFLSSTKHITKSQEYGFMSRWLGTGLLTSTGKRWKMHRKMITPAFHFSILEQFLDVFDKNVKILIEKWENRSETNSFDVYPYIKLLTLDIICESALRTEVHAQIENNSNYVKAIEYMGQLLMDRTFSLFLCYDAIFMWSRKRIQEKNALDVIHGLTDSVIRKRRKELKNHQAVNVDNVGNKKKKLAFLDLLLQAELGGERLSDKDIRDEVNTFVFEGHDTTASAISFCLYNISQHPTVQEKIMEELNVIFKKNRSGCFCYSDLQEMKYLEAVIKETLRLYPSVPIFGREAMEDIVFENICIPKGTNITLFVFALLRDPESFPDPEKFLPERFLLSNNKQNNTYSYVPFSAGPRNCIGQKFAMLEMKSTIAHILEKYELYPADADFKLLLKDEVILKSGTGIKIKIKKRHS